MTNQEIDPLVAKNVMGWRLDECWLWIGDNEEAYADADVWSPSSKISYAWQVVEKMREKFGQSVLVEESTHPTESICSIGTHQGNSWIESHRASAPTAPLAICLAALKACGVEPGKTP